MENKIIEEENPDGIPGGVLKMDAESRNVRKSREGKECVKMGTPN